MDVQVPKTHMQYCRTTQHVHVVEAFLSAILVCVYNARRCCIALRFMTRLSLRVSERFIDPLIDETISFFFLPFLLPLFYARCSFCLRIIEASQLTGLIHCFQQKPNSSKSM